MANSLLSLCLYIHWHFSLYIMKSAVFYCQNSIKISTYIIDGVACNTGSSEKVNQAPEKG